jgi:hypothetical protein
MQDQPQDQSQDAPDENDGGTIGAAAGGPYDSGRRCALSLRELLCR